MDAVITKKGDIRDLVHRSSVVIAHYWPMSGFVHHNPIRSLETYRFTEAVKIAKRFIGGRGYLTNDQYRDLVKTGRIKTKHLNAAIGSVARDREVEFGGRKITHLEALRAHLLVGITAPAEESVPALVNRKSIGQEILALTQNASSLALPSASESSFSSAEIITLSQKLDPNIAIVDEAETVGKDSNLLAWCDKKFHKHLEWRVNREIIKWCAGFTDEGYASWAMPGRDQGFYNAWRKLAAAEWSPCRIDGNKQKIEALPASPEDALQEHLDALGIPEDLRQDYLSHELTSLCGWASFINWRAEHDGYDWQVANPIDLVQYLAVRLYYVREILDQFCRSELGIEGKYDKIVAYLNENKRPITIEVKETAKLASAWRLATLASSLKISSDELSKAEPGELQELLTWLDEFPEDEHGPVWLEAYEAGYHEGLINDLRAAADKTTEGVKTGAARPLAQLMFCIDVRSEPFRRNLESSGNFETIGFAGFFGIPMQCVALDQHHKTDQLPAIVAPKYLVHEVAREEEKDAFERHKKGEGFMYTIHEISNDLKFHVLTPYIMVEAFGWLFGIQLFGRTLFPQAYRNWRKKFRKVIAPPVGTKMTADRTEDGLGLTKEEQAASIEGALRTMGLVKNFGRFVVVAGHTSTSDNNPYEAALNCGACGGNSGKPNARLFAAMANKPHVREHLAKNGINVPDDTHFVGAVHDTTTDIVTLYDPEDMPESHRKDLDELKKGLEKAAVKTNYERCTKLPGAGKNPSPEMVANEISRRAGDWSETRPEWGLAGNAAFIIGGRKLTEDLNLQGRAFLNSHDYRIDPDGTLLEGILNGPMVVGQWINAEHYFSATDTEVYGSGSKIYHNVVGRIGIMSGAQSDLRTGLAWQSMMDGENVYHEPLRLLVVIEAPRDRILELFMRNPTLKQLCDNEWIHLVSIDHDSEDKLYRYEPREGWKSITTSMAVAAE